MIGKSWRSRWNEVSPFLEYPPEIRKAIYTTNAIEALNRQLRKVFKTKGGSAKRRGRFQAPLPRPSQRQENLGRPHPRMDPRLAQFTVLFGDRFPE